MKNNLPFTINIDPEIAHEEISTLLKNNPDSTFDRIEISYIDALGHENKINCNLINFYGKPTFAELVDNLYSVVIGKVTSAKVVLA